MKKTLILTAIFFAQFLTANHLECSVGFTDFNNLTNPEVYNSSFYIPMDNGQWNVEALFEDSKIIFYYGPYNSSFAELTVELQVQTENGDYKSLFSTKVNAISNDRTILNIDYIAHPSRAYGHFELYCYNGNYVPPVVEIENPVVIPNETN